MSMGVPSSTALRARGTGQPPKALQLLGRHAAIWSPTTHTSAKNNTHIYYKPAFVKLKNGYR